MMPKELKNPKAIIFDCFNTLVSDDTKLWIQTFELISSDCKLSISVEEFWGTWKKHESLFRESRLQKTDQYKYISLKPFKTYSKAWKESLETTSLELKLNIDIDKALKIILNQHANRKPFLESKSTLKSLEKEFNLHVVSNADNCFLYPCLEPFKKSISSILSSETARLYKPDARIFQNFLTSLGIHPNEAWYVGDNYLDDIVGSHSAGIQPVWINRNNATINDQERIDNFIEIHNLSELANILSNKSKKWRILND